jgi:hypothetical protein
MAKINNKTGFSGFVAGVGMSVSSGGPGLLPSLVFQPGPAGAFNLKNGECMKMLQKRRDIMNEL